MPIYLGILGYPNLLWPGVNGPFMFGIWWLNPLGFEFGSPQNSFLFRVNPENGFAGAWFPVISSVCDRVARRFFPFARNL